MTYRIQGQRTVEDEPICKTIKQYKIVGFNQGNEKLNTYTTFINLIYLRLEIGIDVDLIVLDYSQDMGKL